ncbi:hypothetical protein FGK60_20770 [Streptomyces sp. DASNCL29]|nr:hypothetical protein FGK60_20770 [Streptomyces sp. DASNCL29]
MSPSTTSWGGSAAISRGAIDSRTRRSMPWWAPVSTPLTQVLGPPRTRIRPRVTASSPTRRSMSSCQTRSGGASIRQMPSAAAPPRRYGHGSVRGCRRAGSNSGSALALSHCTPDFDPQTWRKVTDIYHRAGTPVRFRDKAAVADFFTGPDLIEPGIVVGRGGRRSRQGRRRSRRGRRRSRRGRRRSRRGGRPSTERRGRQSVGRRRHQAIIRPPRRFHGPGLVGPASAKLRACHFLPSELL